MRESLLIACWAFSGSLWALQVYALTGTWLALAYIVCAAVAIVSSLAQIIVKAKS